MNNIAVRSFTLLLMLVLTSCVTPRPQPPTSPPSPPTASGTPQAPADLQGAALYRLNAESSRLHVLVYRGGALANLGHNHVMSCATLHGVVWFSDDLQRSGFNIVVPVNEFIVDDNDARAAEGDDFPLNVSDDARVGTRRNMLSAALLDGAQYPFVTLQSADMTGALPMPQVSFDLTLKDQTRRFSVPVTVERSAQQLHARGEFELRQTDFGIKPFSAAMGALQVVDTVKIKFDLVADVAN